MNIVINLLRIIFSARLIIFLFAVLLCLDGLVLFYYPKYRINQDIHSLKKSITEYFNVISELIADKNNNDSLSKDELISYLKYKPDIKYIAIPDSHKTIIFPANITSINQIKQLPIDKINKFDGQNILSIKIKPALIYNFGFTLVYIGINADKIIENRSERFKNAVIVIALSFFLFLLIVVLYFLDLYKPRVKIKSSHSRLITPKIKDDKIIHDDGILQLKSRLINRKRELKSINNILAATIKSQRNFIKVISHNLKAPLRNVSGLVDSIYRKYPDTLNPDVANRLSRIKKNVDKERKIISDIFINITNQKKILVYEKIDLNEIVSSIIEDLDFEIQDKNIDVNIKNKLPIVYTNRIILKHIFQNLLDNACKYFQKDGNNHIEITYIDNDSDHVFSVRDTGPGISKEIQKTLFHSYDYSQSANISDDMDSGLGLELVSTFIDIINGKIWLESEIGAGSTFFISLSKLDDTKTGMFE